PRDTHVPLTPTLVAALAGHENIWGAKDSTGDLENFAAYHDAAPAWSLFMGSGALYYAALEMDAAGAIAAVANFAVRPTAQIGVHFRGGDKAAAGAAQERVAPLHRQIVGTLGVPGIKAAMDVVGLAGGPPRLPLVPVSHKTRAHIESLVSEAQLAGS
ncbi:MAG: dihydrodipicolinate synthase family protein, partial [Gemmatimonadales bacterium]